MKIARSFLALWRKPSVTSISPFGGAYKDKELKEYDGKYCALCKHKGLIAHQASNPPPALAHVLPATMGYIDSYWCPGCHKTLLPSETYE